MEGLAFAWSLHHLAASWATQRSLLSLAFQSESSPPLLATFHNTTCGGYWWCLQSCGICHACHTVRGGGKVCVCDAESRILENSRDVSFTGWAAPHPSYMYPEAVSMSRWSSRRPRTCSGKILVRWSGRLSADERTGGDFTARGVLA